MAAKVCALSPPIPPCQIAALVRRGNAGGGRLPRIAAHCRIAALRPGRGMHFPHPVPAGSETGGGSGPIFHTLRDAITPAVESGDFTNHMMYKEIKMIKRVSQKIGNDLTAARALVFRPRLDLDNTAKNRREVRYE